MKYLIGFLLGASLAVAVQAVAQVGWYNDEQGRGGSYYRYPNGALDWQNSQGQRGTIYPAPTLPDPYGKAPC